jgi:hypothetical protein
LKQALEALIASRIGPSHYTLRRSEQIAHITSLTGPTLLDERVAAFDLDHVNIDDAAAALHHAVNPRVPERSQGGAYEGGQSAETVRATEAMRDVTIHLKDVPLREAFDAVAMTMGDASRSVH